MSVPSSLVPSASSLVLVLSFLVPLASSLGLVEEKGEMVRREGLVSYHQKVMGKMEWVAEVYETSTQEKGLIAQNEQEREEGFLVVFPANSSSVVRIPALLFSLVLASDHPNMDRVLVYA